MESTPSSDKFEICPCPTVLTAVSMPPSGMSVPMISQVLRVQFPRITGQFSKEAIFKAAEPLSNHEMKDCTSKGLASKLGANLGVLGVIWKRCTRKESINSRSRSVFGA